jgi:hypothetical protein
MRRKILVGAVVGIVVMAASVLPASARWTFTNGTPDLDLTSPDPASTNSVVCSNRITGRSGTQLTDPALWGPDSVNVYTASESLSGWQVVSGGIVPPGDPTGVTPLAPVATFATGPKTALNPAETFEVPSGDILTVYAAAAFDVTLPAGTIPVGNSVLIVKQGKTAYLTATAVSCPDTPPPTTLPVTVDVLPGISPNYVIPSLKPAVLPVRIFGSASVDVTKLATIKVGNATPATVPPWLSSLFAPKDRNGDGFLDRDVLVSPAATGITCASTSVAVTGTLTGGATFAGSDSVKPIVC